MKRKILFILLLIASNHLFSEEIVLKENNCPDMKLIKKVPPLYPREAFQNNVEGEVTIRFLIENGNVINPIIISSNPEGVFDRLSLEAIKKWKYKKSCEYFKGHEQTLKFRLN